jgi:hypothetical protein
MTQSDSDTTELLAEIDYIKAMIILCKPGQDVVSPCAGTIVRRSLPYQDDPGFSGVLIVGERISVKMWYMRAQESLIGSVVRQGQVIGYAQDISLRYGKDCKPHVHLQVEVCDPTLLM